MSTANLYYSPVHSPTTPPTSPTFSSFSSSPRAFEKSRAVQRTPTAPPIKYTLEHSAPSSPSKREARKSILNTVAQKLPGRRRKVTRSTTAPISPFQQLLIPDIIEISANTSRLLDEEMEERERLKEAAARAIGLIEEEELTEATTSQDPMSEDEDAPTSSMAPHDAADLNRRPSPPTHPFTNPAQQSSSSVSRFAGHNRTSSTLATMPIPSFPSTPSQLEPFIQKSATLPKYYPASSLRIFALAKHWKTRYIVLTSPPTPHATPHQPQPSYLHLFRTSDSEEREIERLQVNEDSVAHIAEESLVGGRKGVIKVGGAEASNSNPKKRELETTADPDTTWYLHIPNVTEAQNWIENIKSKILLQRSMRAGLGVGHANGVEPRGDMDVMLSLRAQNMFSPSSPPSLKSPVAHDTASISSRSVRASQNATARPNTSSSSGTVPPPNPPTSPTPSGAVSALKGLFGGSRPRSPSAASSLHPSSVISSTSDESHTGTIEGSFAGAGTNLLLGMVQRSNSSSVVSDGPLTTLVTNIQPRSPSVSVPAVRILERKILQQPFLHVPEEEQPPSPTPLPARGPGRSSLDRAARTMSLQPPPRKRWTASQENEVQTTEFYNVPTGNVTTGSLSAVGSGNPNNPVLCSTSVYSTSTSESLERQRAGSLLSVSTSASGGSEMPKPGRSSRRWSRQGMSLPRRSSPPAGPPPATPVPQSPASIHSAQLSAHVEEPSMSQQSLISGLQVFNKRSSMSSCASTRTSSTTQSGVSFTRAGSSHRTSMPPPQRGPAPTSALPETPVASSNASTTSKSSFAHRALRLSLIAPKPPPSAALPPRPDEPEHPRSRRQSTKLATIPASPVPPPSSSPLSVPSTPLPNHTTTTTENTDHLHIKHRLRIMSAPTPSTPLDQPVASPIGEHIAPPWIQNDPSFIENLPPLQINPTPLRALPIPPMTPTTPVVASETEPYPEFQGLSPPPRRSSKQMTMLEKEQLEEDSNDKEPLAPAAAVDLEDIKQDLSRKGSVISLGVVSL